MLVCILRGTSPQAEIKRAVDIAERAAQGWVVEYTDFYTPPLVADVLANTKKLAGLEVCIALTNAEDTVLDWEYRW